MPRLCCNEAEYYQSETFYSLYKISQQGQENFPSQPCRDGKVFTSQLGLLIDINSIYNVYVFIF